jgi:hypothetical protein
MSPSTGLSAEYVTGTERAAALVELAELAAGRGDLLARRAGLGGGIHKGDLDEDRYLRAAQLCIDAVADTSLIPHWIDVGRASRHASVRHRSARRQPVPRADPSARAARLSRECPASTGTRPRVAGHFSNRAEAAVGTRLV